MIYCLILANHFNGTAMSNYPLRGTKGTYWEGGIRVPAFIYSKMFENSMGYNYTGLFHVTDWYPTIIHMINELTHNNETNLNYLDELDGINQWNSIINNETSMRNEILINIDPISNNSAIRWNQWKLLQGISPGKWYPMTDEHEMIIKNNSEYPIYLFDVLSDPNEYNDISKENPNIVSQLQQKINEYRKNMIPPVTQNEDPNAPDLIISSGHWYSWQN